MNASANIDSNEIIATKLDQLIGAVLDSKVAAKISLDVTLWNTTDVAKYVGVTYKYASEYIVTHHTFPEALRLPTKKSAKGHPRWYAGEVIEWVAKHRE